MLRVVAYPLVSASAFAFVMAALCSRCGHYIFALSLLFFPRLISAIAEWMSTILRVSTHDVALVRI